MNDLSKVLVFKIAFTGVGACIPLLCLPVGVLQDLGFPILAPTLFRQLLGLAYLALIVGYGFGLRDALRGRYPGAVVWMGIVSNGGAAFLISLAAIQNVWGAWGVFAQCLMWGSLICVSAITLGLIVFGPWALPSKESVPEQFLPFL